MTNNNKFVYYCKFSKLSGTLCSGLLLSFLYHVSKESKDDFFCITDKELCKTINSGINQLRAAKKKICSINMDNGPLVISKIKGLPAKTYYKINNFDLEKFCT